MRERLVQIIADGTEELWSFPFNMEQATIISLWKNYKESDFESFEDFMEENHTNIKCTRVFTEEIYI